MYSQCPECSTRFRVTAAALRAAHGTVRCGRCGSAFDALSRLTDHLRDEDGGPAQPAAMSYTGVTGSTGAEVVLLATATGGSAPEFHFSPDDIERVFIDARDWQSRFGNAGSPGDRAVRLLQPADDLQHMLQDPEDSDEQPDDPARETPGQAMWVHEPEAVEDITLEGERIQIEGFEGLEEDFLEREIEAAIEEQHRAETTGSRPALTVPHEAELPPVADDGNVADGFDDLDDGDESYDLDSTDRFEILDEVPGSAYPDHDGEPEPADDDRTDSHAVAPLPAVVAASLPAAGTAGVAAAAATSAPAGTTAPPAAAVRPAESLSAQRWRRPADADEIDSIPIEAHDSRLADELAAGAEAGGARWAWGIGALLLAALLSAQLVHHFRDPLARDPRIGPALRAAYARLGMPLAPNWNLAAFELRQWGASETAPSSDGEMVVRGSIRNGAAFAQPMPLLRLEFEDRFGGTVARRDFAPADYLQDAGQATRLLAAGAAVEAELAIVDATPDAVGYRLDVCLREDTGPVHCAQGSGASGLASQ